ncbi:hypothetical protein GCM10027199_16720 [Amycolatopsis magusensis]
MDNSSPVDNSGDQEAAAVFVVVLLEEDEDDAEEVVEEEPDESLLLELESLLAAVSAGFEDVEDELDFESERESLR